MRRTHEVLIDAAVQRYKNCIHISPMSRSLPETRILLFFPAQITGTPVEGKRRMQFNMFVHKVKKVTLMKELPEEQIMFPIFWVDEVRDVDSKWRVLRVAFREWIIFPPLSQGLELNDTLAAKVRHMLYRPVKFVHIGRLIFVGLGIFMICCAVIVFYRKTKLNSDGTITEDNKTTITQVSPAY